MILLLGVNLTVYSQYLLNDTTVCMHKKQYTIILAKGVEYKSRFTNSQNAIDSLLLAYNISQSQLSNRDTTLATCMAKAELYNGIINIHEDTIYDLNSEIKRRDRVIKVGGGTALVLIILLAIL